MEPDQAESGPSGRQVQWIFATSPLVEWGYLGVQFPKPKFDSVEKIMQCTTYLFQRAHNLYHHYHPKIKSCTSHKETDELKPFTIHPKAYATWLGDPVPLVVQDTSLLRDQFHVFRWGGRLLREEWVWCGATLSRTGRNQWKLEFQHTSCKDDNEPDSFMAIE